MREMKDSGIEWIGEIPKNKRLIRNKYLLEYTKGKLPTDTNFEGEGFPYIGATDLESNEPYKTYTTDKTLPDSGDSDLLVLWDGARAGLCGTHKIGKVSSTIARIREVDSTIYRPFLYWYYKGFEDYVYQRVNGTTIPHMNRKYIEEIQMIDWTVQEQRCISDYLDRKCSQIDSIIARQQEVIEKLKAYKLSVITEAVTKGLNPDVHMKDSGIEWIGKIPEHWTIHKFCWDYCAMLGKMLDAKRITGEGLHPYIKNADVQWDSINFENLDEMDFSDEEKERYTISPGDLMVCEGGEIGKCAIVPDDIPEGIYYQKALHRVRKRHPDSGNIYFLSKVIYCMAKNNCLNTSPEKATIAHLPGDALSQLRIPTPPISEQGQIAEYLSGKCMEIDRLSARKQETIDKLIRYKKSLIYEVVTGKKEV
ncbi:restriction endonuclease subunit S [Pseudoflavonifractor sp. SW1122]|uniref:restriction endonuclease subunit S n=1 Tax=Pseudoflavonifractor sp. SW1122 TaxID=2530044 RepID=UPI00143A9461|nr:restriction endonuclease subunit S [Pseudoflavonifractor sp. SW1122]NJE74085.1 restriction endonuclease subunit S [Pseudoflavonifractor sp. SW1122]